MIASLLVLPAGLGRRACLATPTLLPPAPSRSGGIDQTSHTMDQVRQCRGLHIQYPPLAQTLADQTGHLLVADQLHIDRIAP